VWNFEKLLNDKSPQFDAKQAGQGRTRIPSIASYRAIDPMTLQITTKEPDAFLPYQLAWIAMSSPAHWEKSGRDWNVYAKAPSGSGPWKLALDAARARRAGAQPRLLGSKARVPKLDKLVLLPLPEANARIAALLSGQVDWIEAPAPDAMAQIESAGLIYRTRSRMSGRGSSRSSRARPGTTSGSARGQPLRRPRGLRRPARRLHGHPEGHGAARPSVVGQSVLRHPLRPRRGRARADAEAGFSASKPVKVKCRPRPRGRARCSRCR
jgi:hypothetical protein